MICGYHQGKHVLREPEHVCFSSFLIFSPDCYSLNFSIWAKLAAAVGVSKPKNMNDLIWRLKHMQEDVLDKDYVVIACSGAWDCLRRLVSAKGDYIKPKNVYVDSKEEDED